jgi:hypothetical protein
MPGIEIPAIPADGTKKTLIVPAIADLANPTVTEFTSEGVIDISCYIVAAGWNPTVDQATITDQRQCSTMDLGLPGRKTPNGTDLTGIDNTNHPSYENLLAETLIEGLDLFVCTRRGLLFTIEPAAGQLWSIWGLTVGQKSEVPEEANSVTRSIWHLFPNIQPVTSALVTGG